MREGGFRFRLTTHENVERRKLVFGPGMNTDMRFAQDDHTGHASAHTKAMKMRAKHFGACGKRGIDQQALQTGAIRQLCRINTVKINQQVASGRRILTHLCDPPDEDPLEDQPEFPEVLPQVLREPELPPNPEEPAVVVASTTMTA